MIVRGDVVGGKGNIHSNSDLVVADSDGKQKVRDKGCCITGDSSCSNGGTSEAKVAAAGVAAAMV